MPEDTQETISSQQEISDDQGQDSVESAATEQSEAYTEAGIPQKFVGKTAQDVIQAYQALESKLGQISSERAQRDKEYEQLQTKLQDLEAKTAQAPTTTAYNEPQETPEPVKSDPYKEYMEKFEEDPKGAIWNLNQRLERSLHQKTEQELMRQRSNAANDYYHKLRKENPDYIRREQVMQQLAQQYSDVIKPEMLNSVKVLQALDLMSKGADVGYYEKTAVERAQKDGLSVRDEKRRAQSELSNSEGDKHINPSDLSLDELEKLIGFSDE